METTGINFESIYSMNLDECQALLAKVLTGELKVKDGVLTAPTLQGPRGPTAKVLPRQAACKETLLRMAGGSEGVTAKALLEASNGEFVYTDILLVAREELAKGTIQEARKGRKATWVVAN